jgi:hypothetical protein
MECKRTEAMARRHLGLYPRDALSNRLAVACHHLAFLWAASDRKLNNDVAADGKTGQGIFKESKQEI